MTNQVDNTTPPLAATTTTTTVTAPTVAQDQAVLTPLANDLGKLGQDVVAVVHAYKAGGASSAIALLASLEPDAVKVYTDAKPAIDVIKTGWKTTEFWMVLVVDLVIAVYGALGKVSPFDATAAISALTGVYTVVRGVLKK